jgi:hypothetical protein
LIPVASQIVPVEGWLQYVFIVPSFASQETAGATGSARTGGGISSGSPKAAKTGGGELLFEMSFPGTGECDKTKLAL